MKRIRLYVLVMALLVWQPAWSQRAMPDTVCVGTVRSYQVNPSAPNDAFTWTIDGVVQSSATNTLNMTWSKPGKYLITVQEHGAFGCEGDIQSGLVWVKAPPVPNAGPDAVFCYGGSIRLNGSGGTGFHWTPAAYLSDPGVANPLVVPPGPGTLKYFLDVSDGTCTSVQKDSVTITVLPPVKIFAGNDTSVTINQPLQLHAITLSGPGFTSFTWTPSFGLSDPFSAAPVYSGCTDGCRLRGL
jgi:hypothetical protein